ncbi:MAG: VOC family protein [Methylomicrobium sp.]
MPHSHLDHLAITAPSLAIGVEYVRQTLGVSPQAGGEHPRMGTHNCLLKLGETCYLEVIAINPNAPLPARPRWFQLDEPDSSQPVRLATWIARTDDIIAAATASPIPLGEIEPMSRGRLNWLITLPPDGSLPMQGIAPTLIQWPAGMHPAARLPESGCALVRLEGFHPEADKVIGMLDAIGFEGDFEVFKLPPDRQPYLIAHIQTPKGLRQLSAPGFPVSASVKK